MPSIKIGFSTSNGLFSKLIRWGTNASVSHTFEIVGNDDVIFEAENKNVHYKSLTKFLKEGNNIKEVYLVKISEEQFLKNKSIRKEALGKPYGWTQILGFGWKVLVAKLTGKSIMNKADDGDKTYICVELMCDLLGLERQSEQWSPEDLRKWCKQHGMRVLST